MNIKDHLTHRLWKLFPSKVISLVHSIKNWVWLKEYIINFSATENDIRYSVVSLGEPLHPMGTKMTPYEVIGDIRSDDGQLECDLTCHGCASEIHAFDAIS
jgi:hypothetical protein